MNIQLKGIVLYNFSGEKRILPLYPGKLNILTGSPKTGKTSIINIIDYCFGAKDCKIADGVLRNTVEWVGILFSVHEGDAFIARKMPLPGKDSSEAIYYITGSSIDIPDHCSLVQNANSNAIEKIMTMHLNIIENKIDVPFGQTRSKFYINSRHSLFYNFQHQNDIANNNILFYRQSEPFIPQAIKDTLPYFLGAVEDDYMVNMQSLRSLRQQLKIAERKLSELEAIRGSGFSRAQSLYYEALNLGMVHTDSIPETFEDFIDSLNNLTSLPDDNESEEILASGNELELLQTQRENIIEQIKSAREKLHTARKLDRDRSGYGKELAEQTYRLRSLNLIYSDDEPKNCCPLCNTELHENEAPPLIGEMIESLKTLEHRMRHVEEYSPQVSKLTSSIESQINTLKIKLDENKESIDVLKSQDVKLKAYKEQQTKKAHVTGRISLYLESLQQLADTSSLRQNINNIRSKISVLEECTSNEHIQENLASILSIISQSLIKGAEFLDLEHSGNPLRLDLKRLTVVADGPRGPIPLNKMGSGHNWVGYHLAVMFALHKWFVEQIRPVSSFIVLDQPSQVYFPEDSEWSEDKAERDEERAHVLKMFKFAYNLVQELEGRFQIIVTDHVNFRDDWFQSSIVERWRNGNALVPVSWIEKLS